MEIVLAQVSYRWVEAQRLTSRMFLPRTTNSVIGSGLRRTMKRSQLCGDDGGDGGRLRAGNCEC